MPSSVSRRRLPALLSPPALGKDQSDQSRPEMADGRTRTTLQENDEVYSSDLGSFGDHVCSIPKRHARVTVKYNRKELQRRLDVEKWIDESLDRLYLGQVGGQEKEKDRALADLQICMKYLLFRK